MVSNGRSVTWQRQSHPLKDFVNFRFPGRFLLEVRHPRLPNASGLNSAPQMHTKTLILVHNNPSI
jgi:hypothetical protein